MKTVDRYQLMLDHLTANASGEGDKKLLSLFKAHDEALRSHYNSCVPAFDGSDHWQWTPKVCPLAQIHGPLFHKGFRQVDITDACDDDIAIYQALSSFSDENVQSENFWNAHHHSMQIK